MDTNIFVQELCICEVPAKLTSPHFMGEELLVGFLPLILQLVGSIALQSLASKSGSVGCICYHKLWSSPLIRVLLVPDIDAFVLLEEYHTP